MDAADSHHTVALLTKLNPKQRRQLYSNGRATSEAQQEKHRADEDSTIACLKGKGPVGPPAVGSDVEACDGCRAP